MRHIVVFFHYVILLPDFVRNNTAYFNETLKTPRHALLTGLFLTVFERQRGNYQLGL